MAETIKQNILIKLYKKHNGEMYYWEIWDSPNNSLTIHNGKVGERGRTRVKKTWPWQNLKSKREKYITNIRKKEYKEIAIKDHHQIIVQFKTKDSWGNKLDLEKRHLIEDLIDQALGWSGNGHCDGGDIGRGTINIFSYVVDMSIAIGTIKRIFKENDIKNNYVIARRIKDRIKVVFPRDYSGTFDY